VGRRGSTFAQRSSETVQALMALIPPVYHERLESARIIYG
jgi:hypothetical protein